MPNANTNTTPTIYTVNEACDLLRVKKSTLYARIARGEVQARKLGGRTVVYHDALLRYVDAAPVIVRAAQAQVVGQ